MLIVFSNLVSRVQSLLHNLPTAACKDANRKDANRIFESCFSSPVATS